MIDAPKDLVQQNDTQEDKFDTQEDKFDTQEDKFDTQGYFTEGVIPQKKELEAWIEHQIKKDPKISTGKLAELAKVSVSTIKRNAKLYFRYQRSFLLGNLILVAYLLK